MKKCKITITKTFMIYDKIAPNYDKSFAPFERWFLSNWRAETISYLPIDAKVLEIGAGTGLNFAHYPNCKHAVASELSIKMIEFAKEKTDVIQIIQADAESLPFAENSFDAAFATLVFCSIPNPENAFRELRRIVKPNGKIILLEHVRPKGLLGYLFDLLNVFTVWAIDDYFNRETAKIAEKAGLKVIEIKEKAFGIVNLIVCENLPND
jgi:ubiquinone/menaquinone biosynthesis C-methylase UbiE